MLDAKGRPCEGRPDGAREQHDQHKAGGVGNAEARCDAAMPAVGELLAWSGAIDAAYAAGLDMGRSQWLAADALAREREAQARAEGYAEAVADMKRADRGIVKTWRELSETERARWLRLCGECRRAYGRRPGCQRCEYRTRETYGEPHPDDYPGGPVAWPELPDNRQLAAPGVTAAPASAGNSRAEVAA